MSASQPLVSVCITAYNHEVYIEQAIQSALDQQCSFEYEIVVGVDQSTDRTLEIARQMEQRCPERIRVMDRGSRIGMRRNYYLTISDCRGKYIALLDGDDYFIDPMKLQRQAVELSKDFNTALSYTFSRRIDENGTCVRHPQTLEEDFIERKLGTYRMENCTVMARKDRIMEYYSAVRPEDHPEWLTDDLPMWLYISGKYMISFIPGETAVHRVLAGSVSHCRDYKDTVRFCDSLVDVFLYYDNLNNNGGLRYRLLRKRTNDALWLLSYKGTNSEFIDRWSSDVRSCPRLLLDLAPYYLFVKKLLFRNRH